MMMMIMKMIMMMYSKGEKVLRCKLAAVYRLIDLYGWTQGIYNHVTVSALYIIFKKYIIFYLFAGPGEPGH